MSSQSNNDLYGYFPSLAAGGVFLACFGLLTIAHLGIVVKSRTWWMAVTVVGGVSEIIGWVGRTMSHFDNTSKNPFLMNQVCLIIGPCFFSAALYGSLGMLIRRVGANYSRVKPTLYVYIFCFADLVAIVIQAVGGAKASQGIDSSQSTADTGANIMLAGIVIQLVSMVVFCILGIDFWIKVARDTSFVVPAGIKFSPFASGVVLSSVWILVRCIYRTIELAQGWNGYLMEHEVYFGVLDGAMMVLAMGTLLLSHPAFCLTKLDEQTTLTSRDGSTDTLAREKNMSTV